MYEILFLKTLILPASSIKGLRFLRFGEKIVPPKKQHFQYFAASSEELNGNLLFNWARGCALAFSVGAQKFCSFLETCLGIGRGIGAQISHYLDVSFPSTSPVSF